MHPKLKSIPVFLLPASVAYSQTCRLNTPISYIEKNGIVVPDKEAAEILEEHSRSLFNFTDVYLDKSPNLLPMKWLFFPVM